MCKPCNIAHVRSHYQANRTEILAKRREGNSRLWSSEHRAKLSAAHKGKPKSPEHVEKVRQALIGRKPSQKTVAALRAAKKRIADERLKAMLESGEKHCPKCGETKPLFKFSRRTKGLGGVDCWCKACVSAYHKHRNAENHEVVLENARQYREQRRQDLEWVERNRQYHREYRRRNGIKPRIRLSDLEAKERRRWKKREQYLANPEKRHQNVERARRWAKANPERRKNVARDHIQRKRENPDFRIACAISKAVWDGLKTYGEVKNKRWLDVLGYDPVPALLKMGGGKPRMSIDHCIPQSDFLARIGTDYATAKDALRAAWQLGNLQVIPKPENSAKGAKRTLLC